MNEHDDFTPPSYSTPGTLTVLVEPAYEGSPYKWDYDIEDWDGDTCVFWIAEGSGFEWWLDEHVTFPGPGTYVIKNIVGHYERGDGYTSDDEETWECDMPERVGDLPKDCNAVTE